MKYQNNFERWKKVLLYSILKQTVRAEHLQEAAAYFRCLPSDIPEKDPETCADYDLRFFLGYIRYDEESSWFIAEDSQKCPDDWQEVQVGSEITCGYAGLVGSLRKCPSGISQQPHPMLLSVPAVDPRIAWSKTRKAVGGHIPTLRAVTGTQIWDLLDWAGDDLFLKEALLRDLLPGVTPAGADHTISGMNPAYVTAIRRFLGEKKFTLPAVCFLCYLLIGKVIHSTDPMFYNIERLFQAFCDAFPSCALTQNDFYTLVHLIDILDDPLAVGENSVVHDISMGWPTFLFTLGAHNRWGNWSADRSFLDIFSAAPPGAISLRFLPWLLDLEKQEKLALKILSNTDRRLHHRKVSLLLTLLHYGGEFSEHTVDKILAYLFFGDPKKRIYELGDFDFLTESQTLNRKMIKKYELFLLRMQYLTESNS